MPDSPTIATTDALRAFATVLLPKAASGAIARRPGVVGAMDAIDYGDRPVRELQRLRAKYGTGPVQISRGRRLAFLLDPEDVHRVLNGTPEPFAPDTREKRGALGHFQPEGVLVSTPEERRHRRPFNEEALQAGRPVHDHAATMSRAVAEEVDALLGHMDFAGQLSWPPANIAWWRIVRRVVLGESARDDQATTDTLQRLRKDANWSYLKPTRTSARDELLESLKGYVDRAEPGSLAEMVASIPAAPATQRHQQIPQWLFAFDAACWATIRALALVTGSPQAVARIREEVTAADPQRPDLPYTRATILESLRLYATTPLILRETTEDTEWASGTIKAGTSIVIFTPFFHRDDERLAEAHRFSPELWLRERTDRDWPLVPFSGGPAMCPGRNVVLLVASMILGRVVAARDLTGIGSADVDPDQAPASLSPFRMRFAVEPAR